MITEYACSLKMIQSVVLKTAVLFAKPINRIKQASVHESQRAEAAIFDAR
jgi:hypothetical protein